MSSITISEYKLANGQKRYCYRFQVASVNGKRKFEQKAGFKTRKACQKAAEEDLIRYETQGIPSNPANVSVSDFFLEVWMKKDVEVRCKRSTVENYRKRLVHQILPAIGGYYLKDVKSATLTELLYDLHDRGFSEKAIGTVRGILTSGFDYAVASNLLSRNPAGNLKYVRTTKAPTVKTREEPHIFVKPEDWHKIMERFPVGHPSHIPLMIGYHLGLRLGETFALCWRDIDLEAGTLTVNRQVQWIQDKSKSTMEKRMLNGKSEALTGSGGYWQFEAPKYQSFRTITLDETLLKELRDEKEKQEMMEQYYRDQYCRYYSKYPLTTNNVRGQYYEPENPISSVPGEFCIDFVMRRPDGSYIAYRTLQHTSKVIREMNEKEKAGKAGKTGKAGKVGGAGQSVEIEEHEEREGLENFDYHSLRHTNATMMKDKGIDNRIIAQRLGHKKIEVTENIYSNHISDELLDRENAIINSLFSMAESK